MQLAELSTFTEKKKEKMGRRKNHARKRKRSVLRKSLLALRKSHPVLRRRSHRVLRKSRLAQRKNRLARRKSRHARRKNRRVLKKSHRVLISRLALQKIRHADRSFEMRIVFFYKIKFFMIYIEIVRLKFCIFFIYFLKDIYIFLEKFLISIF